jgi:hypothetical protein
MRFNLKRSCSAAGFLGAINPVIASRFAAKQSRGSDGRLRRAPLDCFVAALLAMTGMAVFIVIS